MRKYAILAGFLVSHLVSHFSFLLELRDTFGTPDFFKVSHCSTCEKVMGHLGGYFSEKWDTYFSLILRGFLSSK